MLPHPWPFLDTCAGINRSVSTGPPASWQGSRNDVTRVPRLAHRLFQSGDKLAATWEAVRPALAQSTTQNREFVIAELGQVNRQPPVGRGIIAFLDENTLPHAQLAVGHCQGVLIGATRGSPFVQFRCGVRRGAAKALVAGILSGRGAQTEVG